MLTTTTLLAAAEEPSRGWGGPIALAIVAAVYIAGATIHHHVRSRQDPSPTGEGDTSVSVKPQVSAASDTDDTTRDTGWWGRIVEVGGQRVRATGARTAPAREADVDLDLDGDDEQDEPETIEDVIDRLDFRGVPYAEIVATVMGGFRVSESTAKRRIRDTRAARAEQPTS
ncbi:hypothetical protein OOK41_31550 [Micromonospora sp. NBC_01655]|uniref:hypothetical protein n=1 Tax=Micromonospora sp. NBC_01655 TaxID=2975983 RepID=UPI0022599E34|nr:hypothetical protein [Micromonospora sp. NBC_01655]MCX4474797.1 hypothetical protein [Micromonospora sp. NBC_01655]